MKLSTLAKRLADKTNTPILEGILLGKAPKEDLPGGCMSWTGAYDGGRSRLKLRRTHLGEVYSEQYFDRPVPVIKFQGKKHQVRRLIFQLLFKPDYEYRLIPTCNGNLCVNPLHHSVQRIGVPKNGPEASEIEEPIVSDEWHQADVDELLEFLFLEDAPTTFQEVLDHPFFEEGPPIEMVREGLQKMNKEHLL